MFYCIFHTMFFIIHCGVCEFIHEEIKVKFDSWKKLPTNFILEDSSMWLCCVYIPSEVCRDDVSLTQS